MTETKERTALVLGATGGIGGEMATALLRRGWTVRALHRDPAAARWRGLAVAWVAGDAMDAAAVAAAAAGASLIVHAVNPPGYRNWSRLAPPMLESSIRAAESSGARILFPGAVYNYGPEVFPILREDSAQHPISRKGAIRVEMEQRLRRAAERGVRTLIVRAGDFFGPNAGNNWFSQGLVKPGRPVASISYPGLPDVGHQWAYLPDLAETMMRLLERESALSDFETFHMDGHWDADGRQMIAAIRAAADRKVSARAFPWPLATLASPFVPLFREVKEMRYLWKEPLRLSNARLVKFLGSEPHTPLDIAVRSTLRGLGCLPANGDASSTESRVSQRA